MKIISKYLNNKFQDSLNHLNKNFETPFLSHWCHLIPKSGMIKMSEFDNLVRTNGSITMIKYCTKLNHGRYHIFINLISK